MMQGREILGRLTGVLILACLPWAAEAQARPLSLDEVLQRVDRFYPQVRIARLEVTKAQGRHITAQGKFDPNLDASTRSQPFGGYVNNYGDTQLNLPTLYNGVKLFAGYRNGQGDWPIYYQNYLTNSGGEYRAGLSLPLLRDRLIDRERMDLVTTSQSILMKHQDAEATRITIYQETITAYWQWVEAGQQVKIFRELLTLAKIRQSALEKQANQGDVAQLAVTENLQQIMLREQLLNQGLMIFEQAGINLSLYYRDDRGCPKVPAQENLPRAAFEQHESVLPIAPAIEIGEHPALKSLQTYLSIVKVQQEQARNELLPFLDATAYTFKQYGSGGYPLLIPQAGMIGLTFKFPLLQREAKGKMVRLHGELQQTKVRSDFLHDQLNNEYTRLRIALRRGFQQIGLLKKELRYAFAVQKGETEKFNAGDSSLFLVNQREQTTTQVKLNLVHAQVDLSKTKDRLRYFTETRKGPRPNVKSRLSSIGMK